MEKTIVENLQFLLASALIAAAIYCIARGFERLIRKRTGEDLRREKTKVNRLVITAMLTAISVLLMYIDFPLPFLAPPFYKVDFSEVPIMIGAFMLGPCAGVLMELLKNLLLIVLKGTSTAFVGELANFMIGCFFVVPASVIYFFHRTKKQAAIGMGFGAALMTIGGVLLNAVYLLPTYAILYGMPVESFIQMGSAINGNVKDIYSFAAICVGPFNLLKAALISVIVWFLYPHLSKILKGAH